MYGILEHKPNPFGGVVTDPERLDDNPKHFKQALHKSLNAWRALGILVVWLEVPISKAVLVPVAVDAGFSYHHAGEDYLLLTLQLVEGAHIPPYATHYIGAGGVVVDSKSNLLTVREKYGFGERVPTLKLPGGTLRSGEHLADAVVREVLEETGVATCFETVVCFRHWHGYKYGRSDIYFVCRLSPLNIEITMQSEEIQECIWMPVEEFLNATDVSDFNKWIVRAGLNTSGMQIASVDGYVTSQEREFFISAVR